LGDLTPFKYREKADAPRPSVEGVEDLTSALVFDEEYIQQFAFQKDGVLKNSFDIFIKTPEYVAAMEEIDIILAGVKQNLVNNDAIEQTIADFQDLSSAASRAFVCL
jgi:hypothetical protein